MATLLAIIIQAVIALLCSIYTCKTISERRGRKYMEWHDRADRARFAKPAKNLPLLGWILYIVAGFISVLPVIFHWSWIVPLSAGLVLIIVQLFVVKNHSQRQTVLFMTIPYATSLAFCLTSKFFAWIGYLFLGLVVIFAANLIKNKVLLARKNKKNEETNEEEVAPATDNESEDSEAPSEEEESEGKSHPWLWWLLAALTIIAIVLGLIFGLKGCNKEDGKTETTSTAEEKEVSYRVDLDYVAKMISIGNFTDKFKGLKADSYPSSTKESKEFYYSAIEKDGVVNPLLLAATSSELSRIGFETSEVKPSELYDGETGALTETGLKVLLAVKKAIFSDKLEVFTSDLGEGSNYYNSHSSVEDGIVYSRSAGITGNTVIWHLKRVDVDSAFDAMCGDKDSANEVLQLTRCGNTVTKTPPTTPKEEPTPKPTPTPTPTPTTPKKDKSKDPVNQGNAEVGGGKNKPDDGAGKFQPKDPTTEKTEATRTTDDPSKKSDTRTTQDSTKKTETTKPQDSSYAKVDDNYQSNPTPATVTSDSHDTSSQNAGTNNGEFTMP